MRKIFPLVLLILISIHFIVVIWANRARYQQKFDPIYWQDRYEQSQWAKGYDAGYQMSDSELYAYASWLMINGRDPTEVNPETPPLGKYLIGVSIILFGNPNIQSPILGMVLLLVLFLLSEEFLQGRFWSLLVVLAFSLERLFTENLATSMLELPLVLLILLVFLFLIKGQKSFGWYLPMIICLAMVSATKTYLLGFGLTILTGAYLFFFSVFNRRKDFYYFLIFSPFLIITYFLIYSEYFLHDHSLKDFAYYHFWVNQFARVHVTDYPPGEILRILLFGKWRTWWDGSGIIGVDHWNWLWPLSLISLIPTVYLSKIKKNWHLLSLWFLPASIIGMYVIGVPFPRYLLPVLPVLYISLVYNLKYWSEKASLERFFVFNKKN